MTVVVEGMWGLGDNVYQRCFIKVLADAEDVYLTTPWPELYEDLPRVRFVRAERRLRTQLKNVLRQPPTRWVRPSRVPDDAGVRHVKVVYGSAAFERGSILEEMRRLFGVSPAPLSLPEFDVELPLSFNRPVAVVRPVTTRSEWRNTARSPRPEYVTEATWALVERGYHVVSVADLAAGEEWLEHPAPPAHLRLHHGELDVKQLVALVRRASLLVGGVGWLVPFAAATGARALVIAGGHGGHNAPEKVLGPLAGPTPSLTWVLPEPYCRCASMTHACPKEVPRFSEELERWLTSAAS